MTIPYMPYEKSDAVKQARMSLIQQALGEIFNSSDHNEFSRKAFYVIAKLGLQLPANEEGLFTNDNRANLFHFFGVIPNSRRYCSTPKGISGLVLYKYNQEHLVNH